jgi:hypothetical protein
MDDRERRRVKEQLRAFLRSLRQLQKEGHSVDDVLQILCTNMADLGMDGELLEELRAMQGGHLRRGSETQRGEEDHPCGCGGI